MQEYVIIVAGGVGTRMKADRPKQFIEINGIPIIVKTMRCFIEYNPQINFIISVHKNYKAYLEGLIEKFNFNKDLIEITLGGETRFDSVKNGLNLVPDSMGVVAIHDAARPFVSQHTISTCFKTAIEKGNAVPSISVNDSMRKISNNINVAVNRNEYKIIQTPQCFLTSKIKQAFLQPYTPSFTDDATVLEHLGETIHLVEGNPENIKITSPHDLLIAKTLLNEQR